MTDVTQVDFDKPERKPEPSPTRRRPLKERIPVLPSLGVEAGQLKTPDQRAVACAQLRLMGAPFNEIADQLGYDSAASARAAYISALANIAPVEDLETLRQAEGMRAEMLFRKSLAMASADYLVDEETGEKIPNADRLRWHDQAAKDLALHAAITGAKAPARVEVSATTQELNQMVHVLIQESNMESEIEADVWEIEEIPQTRQEQE